MKDVDDASRDDRSDNCEYEVHSQQMWACSGRCVQRGNGSSKDRLNFGYHFLGRFDAGDGMPVQR